MTKIINNFFIFHIFSSSSLYHLQFNSKIVQFKLFFYKFRWKCPLHPTPNDVPGRLQFPDPI